jgi:hypothetical protein
MWPCSTTSEGNIVAAQGPGDNTGVYNNPTCESTTCINTCAFNLHTLNASVVNLSYNIAKAARRDCE